MKKPFKVWLTEDMDEIHKRTCMNCRKMKLCFDEHTHKKPEEIDATKCTSYERPTTLDDVKKVIEQYEKDNGYGCFDLRKLLRDMVESICAFRDGS
jgi:hypothetical protein